MLITFSIPTVLLHYNMFTQFHLAEYLTHVQYLLINNMGKVILAKLLHNSIIIFSEDISRNIIVQFKVFYMYYLPYLQNWY